MRRSSSLWNVVLTISSTAFVTLFCDPLPAQDYSAIRRANEDSVVFIHSTRARKDGTGSVEHYYGSGFIISESGFVTTANHVVPREDENTVVETKGTVRSRHGTAYKLEPVKRDVEIDVMLLVFPDVGVKWKPVARGNSKTVPTDAPLVALGFPGTSDLSSAPGILSNKVGPKGLWQTTMPINRGNSGGPVFDLTGKLVAIASAGNDTMQGVTFAIPESYAMGLIQIASNPYSHLIEAAIAAPTWTEPAYVPAWTVPAYLSTRTVPGNTSVFLPAWSAATDSSTYTAATYTVDYDNQSAASTYTKASYVLQQRQTGSDWLDLNYAYRRAPILSREKDTVLGKAVFYKSVDHDADTEIAEKLCLPSEYRVFSIVHGIRSLAGSETALRSISPDDKNDSCVIIKAVITGSGVEKIGPVTVEQKGRGWLGVDVRVEGLKKNR